MITEDEDKIVGRLLFNMYTRKDGQMVRTYLQQYTYYMLIHNATR